MRSVFIFSIVFCALLIPQAALAQFSNPLVPCNGPDCQACHAVELGQNILNFMVSIASFIAVLTFAYAGFLMVTAAGNEGQISKAKGMFTNVFIGIIIVLAGWLIIDTVMKYLFEGSQLDGSTRTAFGPWNQIGCVEQPVFVFAREGNAPGATAVVGGVPQEGTYADTDARAALIAAGVTIVSSGNCSDPSNRTCTSLAGMRQDTVNQVLALKEACPQCTIVVTGGTETGHASGSRSHGAGYKIDIDDNATLDAYLRSKLQRGGTRGGSHGGTIYNDSCGNEYVRENNHWDITVSGGRCAL